MVPIERGLGVAQTIRRRRVDDISAAECEMSREDKSGEGFTNAPVMAKSVIGDGH